MLGYVLPGLRELRAPLAAGYLWLLFVWLVWGDTLPTNSTLKDETPLDRLYRLEPVISSIGLAVVASVAAYILGSIVIDVQTKIGKRIADFMVGMMAEATPAPRDLGGMSVAGRLSLTDAGDSMLERWEQARADELREDFGARHKVAAVHAAEAARRKLNAAQSAFEVAKECEFAEVHSDEATVHEVQMEVERLARNTELAESLVEELSLHNPWAVKAATREYIVSNRDLLKTRLLDASQPLHSDLDRPDAEATFRMALWPPLTAIMIYLALKVSPWWWVALVVPVLLARQWFSLRRHANAALVAAFVAREELGGEAKTEVGKGTLRHISKHFTVGGLEPPPQYLLDYPKKAAPPPSRQPALEPRVPADGGARASVGEPNKPERPEKPHEPEEAAAEPPTNSHGRWSAETHLARSALVLRWSRGRSSPGLETVHAIPPLRRHKWPHGSHKGYIRRGHLLTWDRNLRHVLHGGIGRPALPRRFRVRGGIRTRRPAVLRCLIASVSVMGRETPEVVP